MQLVIAEKPSVAQSIAKVIGAYKREDGYLEGSGYIVSWCVGHLIELTIAIDGCANLFTGVLLGIEVEVFLNEFALGIEERCRDIIRVIYEFDHVLLFLFRHGEELAQICVKGDLQSFVGGNLLDDFFWDHNNCC